MGNEESHVIEDVRDHVLWVTLNRPRQRNAISPQVVCRLADAWARIESDPDIRAAVLTGAGSMFSAGADLKLLVPLISGDRKPESEWDERLLAEPAMAASAFLRRTSLSKPLIAAVNGPAAGGGVELLLATHLRIAVPGAHFALSEVRLGLIPGGGGVARLIGQLPQPVALELLLTGAQIDAELAARHGLINRVIAEDRLLEAAAELSSAIAANGPLAVAAILGIVARTDLSLPRAMDLEDEAFALVTASADAREGAAAFLEKRIPNFIGK